MIVDDRLEALPCILGAFELFQGKARLQQCIRLTGRTRMILKQTIEDMFPPREQPSFYGHFKGLLGHWVQSHAKHWGPEVGDHDESDEAEAVADESPADEAVEAEDAGTKDAPVEAAD